MPPTWVRFLAVLFCLCLCLQLSSSQSLDLAPRQDDSTLDPTPEPTRADDDRERPTGEADDNDQESDSTTTRKTGDEEETSGASESASPTETSGSDDDILEDTIPEGQLPLQPRLTPAFGVAGVLLTVFGLAYLIIGIKSAWLQTFLSVTLLGNLATTVLILYVMTPPVSDGIQGAYLVGIILVGAIMGLGSTIFKEITEGLACILGGFALSMWILTLMPGGMIQQEAPKGAFISLMSVGAFGLFFSRYTRDYALMGLISFGGATAAVMGIDCFSRAGLKEFWAYNWNLNEKLFPDGTTTYPITKGMRVESAVIILLFLIGIISQLKLWRVIQRKRAKKAAEDAEDERNMQAEEEAVGRVVEDRTAREMRAWERVHGSGDSGADMESTLPNSRNSESGDLAEKKMPAASAISTRPHSLHSGVAQVDGPLSGTPSDAMPGPEPALMTPVEGDGANIMVRVIQDEFPRAPDWKAPTDPEEQAWAQNASKNSQLAVDHREKLGVFRSMVMSPAPEVVPLPFQPNNSEEGDGETDRRTVDARSSIVGTYADEDERPQSMRGSLVRRLSQGSTNLLRSLSQRTDRNLAQDGGGSREMLVVRRSAARTDDDRGSLAATVDIASLDDARSTLRGEDGKSIVITADLSGEKVETCSEKARQSSVFAEPNEDREDVPAADEKVAPSEVPSQRKKTSSAGIAEAPIDGSSASKRDNSSSGPSSAPVLLTRDALPESLSRTALKYRTNEWVKHSTTADAPDPGDIYIYDYPEPEEPVKDENPVPLNVDELQQTATTGAPAPAPAPSRPSTTMSNYHVRSASRADSRLSTDLRTLRRSPSGLLPVHPIPEEPTRTPATEDDHSSSRTSTTPPLRSRRASVSPPSGLPYSNSQTLMGRRDTYIRNKPLGTQTPLNGGVAVDYSLPPRAPTELEHLAVPARPRSLSPDEDDMPLSHRRALIRRRSAICSTSTPCPEAFNSHQPQRTSASPHPAVREVQLANFRHSVQADLRSGTPVLLVSGRESVLGRGLEVQRGLEAQRGAMLRDKDEVSRAREAERWGRERRERAFEEMVRSGELMGAHREAMRRLQGQAREG